MTLLSWHLGLVTPLLTLHCHCAENRKGKDPDAMAVSSQQLFKEKLDLL